MNTSNQTMPGKSLDKAADFTGVDLLDESWEPTDQQLNGLMHQVALTANEKSEKAYRALMHRIAEQTILALQNLPQSPVDGPKQSPQ